MPQNFEIIRITADNRVRLEAVMDGVFDHAIDPVQLETFLNDPLHELYVAVQEADVVGMCSGTVLLHPDKAPQLFINEVGVAEGYRCQGIGRNLVRAMVNRASERGCSDVWLGTATDNLAGQACFRSAGATPDEVPFILMEWSLNFEA